MGDVSRDNRAHFKNGSKDSKLSAIKHLEYTTRCSAINATEATPFAVTHHACRPSLNIPTPALTQRNSLRRSPRLHFPQGCPPAVGIRCSQPYYKDANRSPLSWQSPHLFASAIVFSWPPRLLFRRLSWSVAATTSPAFMNGRVFTISTRNASRRIVSSIRCVFNISTPIQSATATAARDRQASIK